MSGPNLRSNETHTLITGASSGIGAGLAERFAAKGHVVWICARRESKLLEVKKSIEAAGGTAHVIVLDVGNIDEVEKTLLDIDEKCGGIDCVIACAGIAGADGSDELLRTNFSSLKPLLDVNFIGAIATFMALVPRMRERKRGHLVGISSIAADVPLPKGGAYAATKAGFTFFMEAAALELKQANIDVTIVHPGFVKTAITEHNKFDMPFLMELDKALDIMERDILRRKKMVRFPFQLGFIARVGNLLPRWFLHFLLPRVVK
ncbi:MAG: SDR family NAD(P)-dependent oxidoreductase [Deltaproteobacteria bacterium]|nr:SDR family NAD(P)-dependent oxidoreductase [Deltaproteobacteria bacterium]